MTIVGFLILQTFDSSPIYDLRPRIFTTSNLNPESRSLGQAGFDSVKVGSFIEFVAIEENRKGLRTPASWRKRTWVVRQRYTLYMAWSESIRRLITDRVQGEPLSQGRGDQCIKYLSV